MDTARTTPKDFFLWAGAMLALYIGVFNYIALLWDYINFAYPDPLQVYPVNPYDSGISWEMASLIVLTPLFLVLMYLIHRDIAKDHTRRQLWVRRWALYLTVFVAAATIAVDLIYVLYAFLNGSDLTTRFLLKALVVLLVAAIGFMHFSADLWNYWEKYPVRNRYVAWGTGALVALSIVAGFFIVGTPQQARLYRFDAQKVSDLATIQNEVLNYWTKTGKLPQSLMILNDPLSGVSIPNDPQGGAYEYEIVSAYTFNLCATFNADSRGAHVSDASVPMVPKAYGGLDENWQHGAGHECFLRTIDPALYPPVKK